MGGLVILALLALGLMAYGAWALVARLMGQSYSSAPTPTVSCPHCGELNPKTAERCGFCQHPLESPQRELADLAIVERQLQRFAISHALELTVVEQVREAVRERRRVLQGEKPRPVTAAAIPPLAPATPAPPSAAEPVVTAEVVAPPKRTLEPPRPIHVPEPKPVAPVAPRSEVPPAVVEPKLPPRPVAVPLKPVTPPKPVPPPKPPRKPFWGTVAAFLEERNIQWAELIVVFVAGLLIVGASIALVITFWQTLQDKPWLLSSIFVAYTAAVFALGLRCHSHWKLEAIGRGLLIIGTLLVPLNFLTMVGFNSWTFEVMMLEAISLALFGFLVYRAEQVLVPEGRWLPTLGVMGNSAALLLASLVSREHSSGIWLTLVGLVPVGVFGGSLGAALFRRPSGQFKAAQANAWFTHLGTAVFTLVIVLGLLIYRGISAAEVSATLNSAALLIVLAAAAILATGLAVMRGTSHDAALAVHRTIGNAIAGSGMLLIVAAVVAAWPNPLATIAVGTIAAAVLVLVAFRYEVPYAHAGAIAVLAVVYAIGCQVVLGHLALLDADTTGRELVRVALGDSTAVGLVGLLGLLAAAGTVLSRRGYRQHARYYFGGCGATAVASLALVTGHVLLGTEHALPIALGVCALYGVGSLVGNRWARLPWVSYVGLGLLAAATLWALQWQTDGVNPLWAATWAAEALAAALAAAVLQRFVAGRRRTPWNAILPGEDSQATVELYRLPLAHVAEALGLLALVVGIGTAWVDRGIPSHAPMLPVTAILLTALALVTAWGYRSPERTVLGSTVLLVGLLHTLVVNYNTWVAQPWLVGFLAHATLAVVGMLLLEIWLSTGRGASLAEELRRVFARPLSEVALASSLLVLPTFVWSPWHETLAMAGCLWWLAALWLLIAGRNRWPALLAGSHVAMSFATVTTAIAWLQRHLVPPNQPVDLSDPRSLQVCGIGLALLGIAWLAARLVLRRSATTTELLNPAWGAVDRLVGYVVVLLHLLLVAGNLVESCGAEFMVVRGAAISADAFGPMAWMLVGLLAVWLLGTLWDRWRKAELATSVLLLTTAAVLVAGVFGPQLAAASAARWSLGVALLLASAAVWLRGPLRHWAGKLRMRVELDAAAPRVARATVVATLALPVLGLTVLAALLNLSGAAARGPLAGTFFGEIEPTVSYLIPLLLIVVSLVGFALRESSAGYAFSAGLVVMLTVVLGFLLHVRPVGTAELVIVLQLMTITAAVWALGWLVVRRWVNVWRERSVESSATALMRVQLGMGLCGNALLLGPALLRILVEPHARDQWTVWVGGPLGWVALVLALGALFVRRWQLGRPMAPRLAGGVGLTVLALLACSVEAYVPVPGLGYRTLMLGLALYALGVVLATWWVASLQTRPEDQGPPQALVRMASEWVILTGLAAVAMGLKAAFLHHAVEDLPWAAAAIAVASLAGATMAYWRRAEGWAFAAAPGVNLAASLVVWYFEIRSGRVHSGSQWLILLAQANVIASMAVALVWLAARQRLYALRDLSIRTSPLLGIQASLGVLGNLALLIPPVMGLLLEPAALPDWGIAVAAPAGWIALALASVAAGGYLWQVARERLGNVVAATGLGIGVLLACLTAHWPEMTVLGDWPAFHLLLASWTAVGAVVLAFGMGSHWFGVRGLVGEREGQSTPFDDSTRIWLAVIGAAVVGLALSHCGDDPARPWWAVGAILGVSLLSGTLGLWQRRSAEVLASALLWNVAACAAWWAQAGPTVVSLAAWNLLAFAAATIVWSLLEHLLGERVPGLDTGTDSLPLPHLTVLAGQILLALDAWGLLLCQATGVAHAEIGGLTAWGVGATVAASLALLWDRRARLPLAALYSCGFFGLVLWVVSQNLDFPTLVWTGALALAAFAFLTAVAARLFAGLQAVWQAVRIPDHEAGWSVQWFAGVQAMAIVVATMLSVWISLDGGFQQISNPALPWLVGRLVAPLALVLVLLASVLTVPWAQGPLRRDWHTGVLVLGLVLLCATGWAWLSPEIAAPWLHRSVILLVAASIMSLLTAVGIPRLLPADSDWLTAARPAASGFGACALVALVAVLGLEGWLYASLGAVPMARPAVAVVALALVGLVAGAITVAVVGRLDPLRLSDRGRTAYVYAAEVLLGLVFVHLRLTMPEYFQSGLVLKYWMFLVLAAAFGGAALSEFFQRRGLPVLSEPLWRTATLAPIAPAIGFWFFLKPESMVKASPLLWFFAAAFYAVLGRLRRSMGYGLLAALVACVGLCVCWHQAGFSPWEHPQLWIIPFALVLLVAEHLNHQRLSPGQGSMLRYLALSAIYFSSSFEYVHTLGESVWLPIVLILLALAGVLVGLVLQVRSFLYMGTVFLGVVLVTMIKYAAFDQEQFWILPTFCIVLGTGLILAFALFKNRREAILAAVERFRTWQR